MFYMPPKPVGHYILNAPSEPSVVWLWSAKPSWWHRVCARVFFGWRWVDQ